MKSCVILKWQLELKEDLPHDFNPRLAWRLYGRTMPSATACRISLATRGRTYSGQFITPPGPSATKVASRRLISKVSRHVAASLVKSICDREFASSYEQDVYACTGCLPASPTEREADPQNANHRAEQTSEKSRADIDFGERGAVGTAVHHVTRHRQAWSQLPDGPRSRVN